MSLRLLAATAQTYAALAQGWADPGLIIPAGGVEPQDTLRLLTAHAAVLTGAQGWGCWLMVQGAVIVGSCAVKAPMARGRVEIGYGVAPEWRGQGVATCAVGLLLPVLRGLGVATVTAETTVLNAASQSVLRRNGFAATRRRIDLKEGEMILWRRALTL